MSSWIDLGAVARVCTVALLAGALPEDDIARVQAHLAAGDSPLTRAMP
ncbi:hypothetical protein V3N99_10370 [Dermatophilaceae bacterium Soc4.6]